MSVLAPEPPAADAPHSAWVDFAVARGHDRAAAAGRTRDQLRMETGGRRLSGEPVLQRHVPEPPPWHAGREAWVAYAIGARGWNPGSVRRMGLQILRASLMRPVDEAQQAAEAAAVAARLAPPPEPPPPPRGPWAAYMIARGLPSQPEARARALVMSRLAVMPDGAVAEAAVNELREPLARWRPPGGPWGPWRLLSDRGASDVSAAPAGDGALISVVLDARPEPATLRLPAIRQAPAYFRLTADGASPESL